MTMESAINPVANIHIKHCNIGAYKGLQNIELRDLNVINVLTGNNNSGKTSILELLETLEDPENMYRWYAGVRFWNARYRSSQVFDGIRLLFPIDSQEYKILYSFMEASGDEHSIELHADIEERKFSSEQIYQIDKRYGMFPDESDSGYIIDGKCMNLTSIIDGKQNDAVTIYDFQGDLLRRIADKKIVFFKTLYLSTVAHVSRIFSLSYILKDAEMHQSLVDLLRIFDEHIKDITIINEQPVEYGFILDNCNEALPISSFGDGMKKTIIMAAYLLQAKDGILLVDEFETAIHTSAMDEVFVWMVEAALRLNVQIFMTSHSEEAINKLLRIGYKEYINVYTLYKHEGINYVRRLAGEEAIHATDTLRMDLR